MIIIHVKNKKNINGHIIRNRNKKIAVFKFPKKRWDLFLNSSLTTGHESSQGYSRTSTTTITSSRSYDSADRSSGRLHPFLSRLMRKYILDFDKWVMENIQNFKVSFKSCYWWFRINYQNRPWVNGFTTTLKSYRFKAAADSCVCIRYRQTCVSLVVAT